MKTELRSERRNLPYKRLEKLITLAIKNNLARLTVGDIEIIPRQVAPQEKPRTPVTMNGKPLSAKQQEDYLLFGPNGIMDEEES